MSSGARSSARANASSDQGADPAIGPGTRHLLTTSPYTDSIYVFDTASGQQQAVIEVGNGPHGIRASRDSHWLYVTVTGDNRVVVIDTDSMRVVARIPVGEFPFWIAVPGNP